MMIQFILSHSQKRGAFYFSADVSIAYRYWVKHPVLLDYRPADCVTTSASNTGCFVMTKGDGKPCKKCGTREWYKGGACKECHRHTLRKWINNNREKHKENFRVWADSNHEYNLERGRKWKEENLERTRQTAREWRNRNIDRARERDKQWAKDNPDKAAAKQRNRRTKIKGGGGSHTAAEFKQLCEQYKNRCLCCGRDDVSLTFDHVVPVNMGGSSDISNGQPLCQSCNSRKGNRYIDYRTKPGLLGWIQKRLFE